MPPAVAYPALIGLLQEGRSLVTWIDEVVRVAAALAALAAFYVAWFVYEDEEKKLQNKIETWWLQFDDFRTNLVSRQAAFLVVVALRASEILDRLFGPKLVGKDAIAAAVSLTIGSYYLSLALVVAYLRQGHPRIVGAVAVAIFACAFAPVASPRLRRLSRVVMWMFVAYVLVVCLLSLLQFGIGLLGYPSKDFASFRDPGAANLMVAAAVLTGIVLTIFQVSVARRAMRTTIAAKSEWPIVAGMIVVAVPVAIVLALSGEVALKTISSGVPLEFQQITPSTTVALGAYVVGMGSFVSTALWGLVAAVASMMLLHRLVWPLASRLLYALGRYRLVQNKVALNTVGATLTGIAITGNYGWETVLRLFGKA